jgi:hypothetical protein
LQRLGLTNQSAVENRFLAVDLASTLYWWDLKAVSEMQAITDTDIPHSPGREYTSKGDHESISRLTPDDEQSVMNFLLRMALVRYATRHYRQFSF